MTIDNSYRKKKKKISPAASLILTEQNELIIIWRQYMTDQMWKMWLSLNLAFTGSCFVPSCSQESQEFASLLRCSGVRMLGFATCGSLSQFTAAKVSCETLVWIWKWALALLFPPQCEQDAATFTPKSAAGLPRRLFTSCIKADHPLKRKPCGKNTATFLFYIWASRICQHHFVYITDSVLINWFNIELYLWCVDLAPLLAWFMSS